MMVDDCRDTRVEAGIAAWARRRDAQGDPDGARLGGEIVAQPDQGAERDRLASARRAELLVDDVGPLGCRRRCRRHATRRYPPAFTRRSSCPPVVSCAPRSMSASAGWHAGPLCQGALEEAAAAPRLSHQLRC